MEEVEVQGSGSESDNETIHMEEDKEVEGTSVPPRKPSKKRKPTSKKVSFVWGHFTIDPSRPKSDPIAICNYCNASLACHSKTNDTSIMVYHLSKCDKYPYNKEKRQKVLSFDKRESESSTNLVASTFNKYEFRGKLARMIVIDEMPFSFVKGERFRDFCHIMCPKFEPVSRRIIGRDVLKLNEEENCILKDMFAKSSHSVCLTIDTWTSIQNINYMSLAANFIDDDWKLHKRILNFCVITNHKEDNIGKLIIKCIQHWGLKRVFTITVDSASANDVVINYVKKELIQTNGCVLDGEFMHVRCCAHILNLIVHDGLKDIHNSVASIRNAVRYVRSSPSRLHKFKDFVKGLKIEDKVMLALDVPTRWNSTYVMLEVALKYQKVFEKMKDEDGHYVGYFNEKDGGGKKGGPPRDLDWDNAKVFVKFLRTFYEITLKFSFPLSVTSNTCFTELINIEEEINELSLSEDLLLRNMASSMKQKYDNYLGSICNMNKVLIIACVLDPRYKMQFVSICFDDMYQGDSIAYEMATKEVKDVLMKLFEWYKVHSSNVRAEFATNKPSSNVISQNESSSSTFGGRKMNKYMKKVQQQDSKGKEVENYLTEVLEVARPGFDVLTWWKVNSSRFQVLSNIARDVFAIPVFSMASESAFRFLPKLVNRYAQDDNGFKSYQLDSFSSQS